MGSSTRAPTITCSTRTMPLAPPTVPEARKTCAPLWTASSGGFRYSSPAVADGVVYEGSHDGTLYAYDAAGVTNCLGAPKTCAPLWTANTGSAIQSSATVANGIVYIGSNNGNLYAFDAAGNKNCSGTPKTCSPLWTAHTGTTSWSRLQRWQTVSSLVGSLDHNLYAYDAAGVTKCSGTPKICSPLWTASTGNQVWSSPAVVNGVVYIGSGDGNLYAFDAAGITNCSGTPKKCAPLWTARTGGGSSRHRPWRTASSMSGRATTISTRSMPWEPRIARACQRSVPLCGLPRWAARFRRRLLCELRVRRLIRSQTLRIRRGRQCELFRYA